MANEKFNENQFSQSKLIEGLDTVSIPMNRSGAEYTITATKLGECIKSIISDNLGITEVVHVSIYPEVDRSGSLCNMYCKAFFDTTGRDGNNIVKAGFNTGGGNRNNNNGKTNLLEIAGGNIVPNGSYKLSDTFKSVMFTLCNVPDGKPLPIRNMKNQKNIAELDLDFNAVMCIALGIDDKAPYDFSVIQVEQHNNGNDVTDFELLISKYIDLSTNNRRRNRRNGIDFYNIDKQFMNNGFSGGRGNRRF